MVSDKSYVRITEDKSEAWLYLCAPDSEADYDKAEIIRFLQGGFPKIKTGMMAPCFS